MPKRNDDQLDLLDSPPPGSNPEDVEEQAPSDDDPEGWEDDDAEAADPDEFGYGDDDVTRRLEVSTGDAEDAVIAGDVLPALAWLDPAPPVASIIRDPHLSRRAGAVLGGAIGDAMGHPTEFISSFQAIKDQYGPEGVTGYELYWSEGNARFAPYTDDTQMAEVVLRALLEGRRQDADLDATMRLMAEGFVEWSVHPQGGHRAPGNACMSGCRALARGAPWSEAGGATAGGCGSVMRAYPFGLIFHDDLAQAERWAVAHSRLTHRDPIALAASAAMAVGVARVLRDDRAEVVLSEMVAAACRYSAKTAQMMAQAIDDAESGVPPTETLQRLQAWAAHEAIAAAVYLLARHPTDPRAAILEGANTPGDSDSIATLAGALVGARVGLGAFPEDWVQDIERRDTLLALAAAI